MGDKRPLSPEGEADGGAAYGDDGEGCPAAFFARRSFLQGTVATGLAGAVGAGLLDSATAHTATPSGRRGKAAKPIPFHGYHQAGIAMPRQRVAILVAFDVTASGRKELTDLLRTLTARARFLTAGGTVPKTSPDAPPSDTGIVGPEIVPDQLTPVGVAVTPDGGSVYVANEVTARVSVISTRTGKITATVPVGQGVFGVTLAPDGKKAYAAVLGPGDVAVIDTASRRVTGKAHVGPPGTDPFNIAVTSDTVYVTDQGAGTFSIIDRATLKVTATLTLGNSPYGVAVSPR
ncbi:Dyp-type peroxidase domain-containing protein [Streptomyces sp. NPDC102274]|uniref:Dyp-type peroxidase domain-containing protein n=1 Tax=Streptomyces sp. NPDC102274 TaxID=3366151 RepID=UPI00380566B1